MSPTEYDKPSSPKADDQRTLCRNLQLLQLFHQADAKWSNRDDRLNEQNEQVLQLNTIALYLRGPEHGDVVAAAFDTSHGEGQYRVVLARNRPHKEPETLQASAFFTGLLDSANDDWLKLFRDQFGNCKDDLQRRLKSIWKCDSDTIHPWLESRVSSTSYDELRESLKVIEDVSFMYQDKLPDDANTMEVLFNRVGTLLKICITDEVMQSSLFGQPPVIGDEEDRCKVESFINKINRLHLYKAGLKSLIEHRDQLFGAWPSRLPDILWATPDLVTIADAEKVSLPPTTLDAAIQVLTGLESTDGVDALGPQTESTDADADAEQRNGTLSPIDKELLASKLAKMNEQWAVWDREASPLVHAELRLLLFCEQKLPTMKPGVIGCSKRSCLCCNTWISEYNGEKETNWMIAGSHGKAFMNWRLPGKETMDKAVAEHIHRTVKDVLITQKGARAHRRGSRESHVSIPSQIQSQSQHLAWEPENAFINEQEEIEGGDDVEFTCDNAEAVDGDEVGMAAEMEFGSQGSQKRKAEGDADAEAEGQRAKKSPSFRLRKDIGAGATEQHSVSGRQEEPKGGDETPRRTPRKKPRQMRRDEKVAKRQVDSKSIDCHSKASHSAVAMKTVDGGHMI